MIDKFEVLRTGFCTSESRGDEGHYMLNVKFHSLADLQAAHRELLAAVAAPCADHPGLVDAAGLLGRVVAAEQRLRDGHGTMRVPADPTDPDLVLAEVRMLLEGKGSPFWIKPPTTPKPDGEGWRMTAYGWAQSAEAMMAEEAVVACRCEACVPMGNPFDDTRVNIRMIVCATCGNKRCPHATNHLNPCTGSNDIGQKGSSWENVKPVSAVAIDDAPPAKPERTAVVSLDAHNIMTVAVWRLLAAEFGADAANPVIAGKCVDVVLARAPKSLTPAQIEMARVLGESPLAQGPR